MTNEETLKRFNCIRGIQACTRAGEQTPAMFALNRYVLGTFEVVGPGIEAVADRLLAAGFDPPKDPQFFSAAMACNLLNIPRVD